MGDRPKQQATDIAHAITSAALGAITAGVGSELFKLVIAPPLEERRNEWLDELAERLISLERDIEGFSLDALPYNDAFISAIMHATTTALKNHNQTKLEMLRNAVLNTAVGFTVDDSVQLILLRLIDVLTPWHLKLLSLLNDPPGYASKHGITFPNWSMGGVANVIESAFPDLCGRRSLYDQLGKDLEANGLIEGGDFHITITVKGMLASRTTELGKMFIAFVTSP